MEPKEQDKSQLELVLRYLDVYEVDEFVIRQMQATSIAPELLTDVVKGNIKCTEDQLANAIAILGALREASAVESLVSLLEQGSSRLQFHALAALGQIGPDAKAQTALKALARDERAKPALVAYAIHALKAADDPTLRSYFRENPPAHLEDDSGVREALAELVGPEERSRRPFDRDASATEQTPKAHPKSRS